VPFAVNPRTAGTAAVLEVTGELDIATAPALQAAVDSELAAGRRSLVVDLTPTEFLDSSACRVLALSARACSRVEATLVAVCPPEHRTVRRVLDFMGLDEVVPVLDRLPEGTG